VPQGKTPPQPRAGADVFAAIASVGTPQEALLVTLNERGCVDLDYLGMLLHRRPSESLPDLKNSVFLNPQTTQWETEDDYLSGDVRAKLAAAEDAALVDEKFTLNAHALMAVQPADLCATQIDARLGSTWIPSEYVRKLPRSYWTNPASLSVMRRSLASGSCVADTATISRRQREPAKPANS
jgi:hypothetical protein